MRTRYLFGVTSAVGVLFFGLSSALALPLAPGGTLFPAPGEPEPTVGATVADTGVVPFVAATFTGSLRSVVIADPTNPLGGLTFIYQVTNNLGSPNDVGRLTVRDFSGWATDASFQTTGGLPPALINRPTPDVVGFSFMGFPVGLGTLAPGVTSSWLVVQTDAPSWTTTTASVIDGSVATVTSFGPVPEPATLCLLGMGLGCLIPRRVKRS